MCELVSIIVPIYNTEKFLNKCIESLTSQTYQNIEILLLNDGSKDKSLDICKYWQKKDKRIVVKSHKNQGVSKTRNLGLDISKGAYVSFVDSDYYVEKEFIKKMLDGIVNSNADVIECSMNVYNEDNQIIGKKMINNEYLDNQETIKYNFANLNNTNDFITNKMFKRSIIGDIRFSHLKVSEDYEFLTYIYEVVQKKVSIDEALYNYYVYERNYDSIAFSLKEMDTINARKKIFEFYKQNDFFDLMNITAVQILSRIMSWYKLATVDVQDNLYNTFKEYYKYAIKAQTPFAKKIYRIIKYKMFLLNPNFATKLFHDK